MKARLELNICDNGQIYLNYWDWKAGKDIICEVIEDKIIHEHEVDSIEQKDEVTIGEFIKMVKSKL